MVLVITGQLVSSFDEEFRRLYARSTVPAVLSKEKSSVQYLKDSLTLQSPNSSQLSLHQIHMRPKVMHGLRSAQDDRFNSAAMMTRGLSVQERLNQSHCLDMGNLVRGHSYGGELQKLNSMTRLRMGTKDILPTPEKTGLNLRAGAGMDLLLTNRLSQHRIRHGTRYGADQNLIPFNSETSLHRWKMDTYLKDNEAPLDASCDAISPLASPYSSYTGLNEHQSQLLHTRSRDIKTRMEEMRQKRLSLQEYNLRQSQESLRSVYQTLDRPKLLPSLRGMDMRQGVAELDSKVQNGFSADQANHKDSEPNQEGNKREQTLTDGQRSASHYDVTMAPDRKTTHTYDWHEPLSRTSSAAGLDMKLNDPSLKLAHLQPSGLQHPRAMESLTQIPEEKEGSRVNSSDSAGFKDGNEETLKDEKPVPKENSVKSSLPAESQHQDQAKRSPGSVSKVANSSGSGAPRERKKSTSSEGKTVPKILNPSTGSQHAVEAKSSHTEKKQAQHEEQPFQRKNSLRKKVYSMLTPDDKKASKKEEKSLQRKASLRSQKSSGSNQPLKADHSQAPAVEQTTRKGQSPSISRSHSSLGSHAETEKHKSPFPRLSPQRSSKKKSNPAAEQDQGSRSTLSDEGATVYQTRREKAYSRFEYLLSSTESIPQDKSMRVTSLYPSEKERGSSMNRHDPGYQMYQTQSGTDNKLGRFMQRVGSLISKNK